ncbi:MAG: hypothetical protein VW946_04960 [Gammaproteobacteria bacterium]|jgi:hypothetical protein
MYSDNIKFGEQPDDIYDHVEQLEGDIQQYREKLKKHDELVVHIKNLDLRLFDLETYIHGPTRKPYDWEEK